jgi:hypothetical protein
VVTTTSFLFLFASPISSGAISIIPSRFVVNEKKEDDESEAEDTAAALGLAVRHIT